MNAQDRHNLFAELITTHQSQLYGYIFALVRNRDDAADLFQSVCVVLWKKFDSFKPDAMRSSRGHARLPSSWCETSCGARSRTGIVTEELLDAFTDVISTAKTIQPHLIWMCFGL